MEWVFQAYKLTLAVAFILSAGVAKYTWERREETGAKPLIVLLVGEMIWVVAAFFAVHHRGATEAIYYSKFWFPGVNLAVLGFFLLALEYTGRGEYITFRTLVLLLIEPVVFNFIVWTNEDLVWEPVRESSKTMRGFVIEQNPAFMAHAVYSYILLAAGTVMIVRLAFRSERLYRRQSTAILLGMSASWVGNILYLTRTVPIDTSPLGFAVSGIMLGWAILSAQFLDIMPIARDALVETLQDGVFVLDRDARVIDINERGKEILGYHRTSGEIGDTIQRFVHESVPVAKLESLHLETVKKEIEVTIDDRYYTVQTSPLYGIRDEFVGKVFLVHDITEQKRRQDELAQKNEQLDQFASVVSHDLRNPLNVATGYTELARETHKDEHFDRIENAHYRMETLIEDLLTLARENDQANKRESVSLSAISQSAWNSVQTEGATLDLVDDQNFQADPDRLQQLFENLFRNAVEHGPASEGASENDDSDITVTVGKLDEDGFFVEDDGVGIDPDIRDRILEMGVTTSDEGTGLGLAIVKNVIDAHGWELNVTDSAEGGSRFEIRGVAFSS